ncbi:MAG: hypothetical protein LBR43_02625 [Spiroplasmataceae bacterium]|jgi:membrane protein implicated in regulation of membrane protease activity|nr:hypothetical protein [Spiroplasmataceae bacterium]
MKNKLLEFEEFNRKDKEKELWKNRLNISITWFGGSLISCIGVFFLLDNPWNAFYALFASSILGLLFLIWAFNGLNNVNQEIEKLKGKR